MNTIPVETSLEMSVVQTAQMPLRRVLNAYWTETKYALIRFVRLPAFAVPTLLFPVLFYLLVGFVFGVFKISDPNVPMHIFTGFAVMAAMTPGVFGFGMGLAVEREHGLFAFKRALPMPPMASLLASTAMSVISAVVATLILSITALAMGTLDAPLGRMAAIVATVAIGAVPFCALGLLFGVMLSAKAAPGVVNIVYMVMIYFSGLFIPLPEAIQPVVFASPAFYLHQLMLDAAGSSSNMLGGVSNHLVVLLGTTVLCLCLAARRLEKVG